MLRLVGLCSGLLTNLPRQSGVWPLAHAPAAPDTLNPVPTDTPSSVDQRPPSCCSETLVHHGHEAALTRASRDQNSQSFGLPSTSYLSPIPPFSPLPSPPSPSLLLATSLLFLFYLPYPCSSHQGPSLLPPPTSHPTLLLSVFRNHDLQGRITAPPPSQVPRQLQQGLSKPLPPNTSQTHLLYHAQAPRPARRSQSWFRGTCPHTAQMSP